MISSYSYKNVTGNDWNVKLTEFGTFGGKLSELHDTVVEML